MILFICLSELLSISISVKINSTIFIQSKIVNTNSFETKVLMLVKYKRKYNPLFVARKMNAISNSHEFHTYRHFISLMLQTDYA